ncbi:MAG: phosphoenolpyruvate synthase [Gammaproteobacteria bacterium]|uniref:Phosphoenolpyruvate synthase n=1 Tax=Candidatus Thiopontia autotrophica TaxID=2841688 RepID=A0A8J6P9R5_9GAMM|nr:phosphoenolpyruvate synthase [Candidatus Thiopontia autotrophica]MBL6968810.1 phosphoenolpyruvate synthase [Gammaproteobacteria bacterium]
MVDNYVVWLDSVGMGDVGQVGGKNASLGEMIHALSDKGVRVPNGFATTAHAFRDFLAHSHLTERIHQSLEALDPTDIHALKECGAEIRRWILDSPFPVPLLNAITSAYEKLEGQTDGKLSVAIRSSATAEDLADASFAGQQESYLNVCGVESVLASIKNVFASLYNDRAISYRAHQHFDHQSIAISVGVQQMVRSDLGSSGVLFTLDTESGFRDVILITSAYGLGETVVQGAVNPDEFYLYKPTLATGHHAILSRTLGSKEIRKIYARDNLKDFIVTERVPELERNRFSLNDRQIHELGRYAVTIEEHYGRPMDIEWALDGVDNKIYIVQSRPETVKSQEKTTNSINRYKLKERGTVLAKGRAIGQAITNGTTRIIANISEMERIQPGDILVTDMTDPDWEPIMKRASAIVTNRGGRTCHAAIIARELGIPTIVGTGDATESIPNDHTVTISCAEGDDGYVYDKALAFELITTPIKSLPPLKTRMMVNIGNPGRAFDYASIPNDGVGLARMEFIISNIIGIHPRAIIDFENLPAESRDEIERKISGYGSPIEFYVEKLTEGIATIAAPFSPNPVRIRTSDFKSNEYANLIAGREYEPFESNPMIGYRGALRQLSEPFRPCFELECKAIKRAREKMGLSNIELMIPFIRTLDEAIDIISLLEENGLKRGEDGLRIIMMCEVPSNVILAEEFLEYFDGFSIGSNDLTQLTLGMDRDSEWMAAGFDERNPAIKESISRVIQACHNQHKSVGICGEGPSHYPEFARWLVEQEISSISMSPNSIIETWNGLG